MEEEPLDPYEKQLFAVFKSCLAKDQTELDKGGLLNLCIKLELEESHKETILQLLKTNTDKKSIPFSTFRNEFLALLDKSQENIISEKEVNVELETLSKSSIMCNRLSHSYQHRKSDAMNCQQTEIEKIQKLQEAWCNQNFLTMEDVNSVFNKGFTFPKQAIELIFEKLDENSDGLINFNEFLHFFQSSNDKVHDSLNLNWSIHEGSIKLEGCKDFTYHQTSKIQRSAVTELWELAGVSEPNLLLLNLGFDGPTVSLIDLSNALSSELKVHHDVSHTGGAREYVQLLKAALSLYQEEVRNLNLTIEHLGCERDKLRTDITDANERANLLAQEVDEHQVRMDKAHQEQVHILELKHSDAVKGLTKQLQLEREKSTFTLNSLEEQLQTSQQEEHRIKTELLAVLEELKSLEKENLDQNNEIDNLKTNYGKLTKRVQELVAVTNQVESIETKENDQVFDLMSHITRLQAEMKVLRDHNDELTSELELLKNRDVDAKSIVSSVEVRSIISDDNDGLTSMPTTEVSDTEDEEKTHSRPEKSKINLKSDQINTMNKLSEIIQEFRNFMTSAKFCAECTSLRNEVSSLINELELYQSSMPAVQVLVENCYRSGKRKKPLKNLANELEAESEENASESCSYLNWKKKTSNSDDRIIDLDDNYGNVGYKNFQSKFKILKDYSLQKEIEIKNNDEVSNNNLETSQHNNEDNLNEEENKYTAEKKKLLERCIDLEESLRLLRVEYEQCEDYWASKLDEERQIFEQEQKISDEKFSELITKMAEYEEQFAISDKMDGRLSPIEEKVNLEQQYNDLENEFERWKLEAQNKLSKKEKEIEDLKKRLTSENIMSDISVQFPDEQLKTLYPELYSHLCLPLNSSIENASCKSDTVSVESIPQQCLQCHKIQSNCNCHSNSFPQKLQSNQGQQRLRKSDGKTKYHHYNSKKTDLDFEISSLIKQKEKLKQEIFKLQSLKNFNANHIYPIVAAEEQSVHQNILANLYSKLYNQEQKIKYMQIYCQTQQREHERIVQGIWKSHLIESNDLHFIIKSTKDKLSHQIKVNKEQKEKLTQADFLSKELYVENAKLAETIKCLEQHCQILSQNRIDSTSANSSIIERLHEAPRKNKKCIIYKK